MFVVSYHMFVVSHHVFVVSLQAHSSVERAALIGVVRMHKLETDENGALHGDTLQAAIAADNDRGLIPFFVSHQRVSLWRTIRHC